VSSLPQLFELHRAKEHQIELLAALERELVLVGPQDKPAIEAEIVDTTREIDRLVAAIRALQTPDPSANRSSEVPPGERKTKPVIH
jgi:hypothetical protein